jgi:hypothetical protein
MVARSMSIRARTFALLPLAALGVHQFRYLLAFGDESSHELAAEGHSYLASLTPALVFVAALIAAELVYRLARASRGEDPRSRGTRLVALAAAVATILIAIYAAQELLEGWLSAGHPEGLPGVFGEGGWWAIPIAIAFGAAIAVLLRGADAAVAAIARLRARRPQGRPRPRSLPKPGEVFLAPVAPLAAAAPGRAPPR